MIPEDTTKPKKNPKEDCNVIFNKIGALLSQRESLVRSWYSIPSARLQEEFDADDEVLFCNQPGHLGIGASIPSNSLESVAERNNKSLRSKLLGSKYLIASKTKATNDKVTSMRNVSRDDSSDEELGRSSLGRLKKQNLIRSSEKSIPDKIFSDETFRQSNKFPKSESPKNQSEFISDMRIEICCTKEKIPIEEVKTGQADTFQGEKHLEEVNVRDKQKLTQNRIKAVGILKNGLEETNAINREEKKRMKKREKKKRQKLKAKNLNPNN